MNTRREMQYNGNRKRLEALKKDTKFLFWISSDLHQEIKIRAAARNASMGDWIIQAIAERIKREERFAAKE